MTLNLLTEPLFRFEAGRKRTMASLPEVYAALMNDEVDAFMALRPHQRHAWHAFLSQLGALALMRGGTKTPPVNGGEWATLLRGLTPDFPGDEPWHLVVDDITRPAFMQPPARTGEREKDYKSTVATPDELDMLVTSKNHDLKSAVGLWVDVDDWAFALIALQTMEGFSGAGNYGISRMNGGLGNRPAFSLAPSGGGIGAHVRRDMTALLDIRQSLLTGYGMTDGGFELLWTLPWDGAGPEALNFDRLDPLYIEICRRIRLCLNADGQLQGVRATSKAARINISDLKGRTGDAWTPFNSRREGLPLTLGPGGFTYKRTAEYLVVSADWEHPALLRPTQDDDKKAHLVARAMVRGQGKTEGYHERIIPIGDKLKTAMQRRGGTRELGDIARQRIEQVDVIQRILSHAIQIFIARGDEDGISPEHRALARRWLNGLDEIVDARFFEELQAEFEVEEAQRHEIHNRWLMNGSDGVVDHARALLYDAEDALPCPAIHRYKARVKAESLFERRLRSSSGLPFLFDQASRGRED